MYRKSSYPYDYTRREPGTGFVWLILLALIASAILKNISAESVHRAEERAAAISDMHGITERFYTLAEPMMRKAESKGIEYGARDYIRDRNEIFALSDSMAMVHNTMPSTIGWLHDLAQRNIATQSKLYALEMSEAERELGAPMVMQQMQERNVSFLIHAPVAIARHALWFGFFIMPFLLILRMLYERRSIKRMAVEIFYHPFWLATCSMLWPFMALKHADIQPRVTLRFFYLRFAYMWSEGRMFLTVAEKNALLSAAGKPGESARMVFAMVKAAPALATEAGRRYAIVSFMAALFGFGSFNLQPVMAQTVTEQTQVQSAPSFTLDGFAVTTLTGNRHQQGVELNYFRLCPNYHGGKWSASAQVDPTGSTHVKWAFIKYVGADSSDLQWSVEAGRLISNYAYTPMFPAPTSDPMVRSALDDFVNVPFFDNGVMANVNYRGLAARFGALNGSGGYDDDNVKMDVTARLTAASKFGTVGATYLSGMQPDGMREFRGADITIPLGPIILKSMFLERNNIHIQNGIATQVVFRAGPTITVAAQYEHASTIHGSVQYGDIGVNLTVSKQARILAHTVIGTDARPICKLRLVHTF